MPVIKTVAMTCSSFIPYRTKVIISHLTQLNTWSRICSICLFWRRQTYNLLHCFPANNLVSTSNSSFAVLRDVKENREEPQVEKAVRNPGNQKSTLYSTEPRAAFGYSLASRARWTKRTRDYSYSRNCPIVIKLPFTILGLQFYFKVGQLFFLKIVLNFVTVTDCMTIPPREEWERMLEKAERQAKDLLSKYEKKCKDIEVINQSSS